MGDLHATAMHADLEMIRSAVGWLGEEENRYAVVPGDIFDTAIKGSVSLDLSEIGMSSKDGRHLLARMLEPVKHRILVILSGNHDDRLTRDAGSDEVDALACHLGIGDRYFPEGEAFIRLKVGKLKHDPRQSVLYNLYMTHGDAGGRLPGGKANSLLALRNIVHNADVYLNGHGHTPMVLPEVAWAFSPKKADIIEQKQLFASCGSSLKRAGYPVKKGYPPLARVWPTFTLYGEYKHMSAHIEH